MDTMYLLLIWQRQELKREGALASQHGVYVDFFTANIEDMQLCEDYDIVLCSGVFHFLKPEKRKDVVNELKQHTKPDGIHVMNVFVDKPFVEILPGKEKNRFRWKSGQIFTLYHDWYFHKIEEVVFDCNSGVCHTSIVWIL